MIVYHVTKNNWENYDFINLNDKTFFYCYISIEYC